MKRKVRRSEKLFDIFLIQNSLKIYFFHHCFPTLH